MKAPTASLAVATAVLVAVCVQAAEGATETSARLSDDEQVVIDYVRAQGNKTFRPASGALHRCVGA
jgi:hypothetical protein